MQYEKWNKRYEVAANAIENKEEILYQLYDELEQDLELIGSTAIEDRLQDEVRKVCLS